MKQLEAVYERGVLRPLEPLALREKQRVRLTLDVGAEVGVFSEAGVTTALANDRRAEFAWLAKDAGRYAGQWVALDGGRLVAHGEELAAVRAAAPQLSFTRIQLILRIFRGSLVTTTLETDS